MDFHIMKPGQESLVINLVKEVFDEFVAPGYSQEGIIEFYKYANEASLSERSKSNHFTIFAEKEGKILGILEIRDLRHISMFFVRAEFQKQGVGRSLLKEATKQIRIKCNNPGQLTVNSSPNSVDAYKNLGFIAKDDEQCINGIRFIPMELMIQRGKQHGNIFDN